MSVKISKPLMRALFFDAANDPEIWRWPYEYFLGNDLLLAPVTAPGVESWQVYLPRGKWVDAWTGEQLSGPLLRCTRWLAAPRICYRCFGLRALAAVAGLMIPLLRSSWSIKW